MNATPLGQIIFWFRDAHENILKLAEGLSDEKLAWQPHPTANSIAFQLWHLARSADYVYACLSNATLELGKRLGPRRQLWLAEGLAAQWGLDPTTLGIGEMGWEMAPADAAQMQLPSKDVLLDYIRRSFASEEQALDALDNQQFQELRLHDWATTQTVGNFLMSHFVHEREHYGIMLYLRGLYDLSASKSEEAAQ